MLTLLLTEPSSSRPLFLSQRRLRHLVHRPRLAYTNTRSLLRQGNCVWTTRPTLQCACPSLLPVGIAAPTTATVNIPTTSPVAGKPQISTETTPNQWHTRAFFMPAPNFSACRYHRGRFTHTHASSVCIEGDCRNGFHPMFSWTTCSPTAVINQTLRGRTSTSAAMNPRMIAQNTKPKI